MNYFFLVVVFFLIDFYMKRPLIKSSKGVMIISIGYQQFVFASKVSQMIYQKNLNHYFMNVRKGVGNRIIIIT